MSSAMNPKFSVALFAAMRIQRQFVECAAIPVMSAANARATLDQLRADVLALGDFLDDVEERLDENDSVSWGAR
jgi:hypothetical protein